MTQSNSPNHLARLLAIVITDKLAEFSAEIPLPEAEQTALQWVLNVQESNPETLDVLANSHESIQALGDEIAYTILSNIAEERPGTNPWSHERRVPLPYSLAFSQLRLLTAVTQVALFNKDYRWAENAVANTLALTTLLAEPNIGAEGKLSENRLMLVPQPAMAYVARYLKNTHTKIENHEWVVSSQTISNPEEFPVLLSRHAAILSKLTSTFGRPVGPNE